MIYVFGAVCMDRLHRVPRMPPLGGYVEIAGEQDLLGGEAANTATVLRSWGDEVVLLRNPLGRSAEGRQIEEWLTKAGIESVDLLAKRAKPTQVQTPICDIYVTDDGERTMFGKGFSNLENFMDLPKYAPNEGDWFTAEPNIENLSRAAASQAHELGLNLYLMDFFRDDDPVFPGSYWQSSTDWVGTRGDQNANVEWVKAWIAKHQCTAILSDGANGLVAGSPENPPRWYPPFPAGTVVDTTGAGDAFRAGMLHGLVRGWPTQDCLRFAAAAGCLSCRSLGATTLVPTIEEIGGLIAAHPGIAARYVG